MPLVSIEWDPDEKQLNGFRWVALGLLPVIAVVLHVWKHVPAPVCLAIAGTGLLIWATGFVSLRLTRWIYLALTVVTYPIGLVVSLIVMAVFFYGILTPIGLVFRLMGRDALTRSWDEKAGSYWADHEQVREKERYFHRF